MGLGPTLLLGLIAGGTILLGLPIGRIRRPAPALRTLLNAVAVGVLLFLVWDVLSAAWEPIDTALAGVHEGTGGLGSAIGYGALFVVGDCDRVLAQSHQLVINPFHGYPEAERNVLDPRLEETIKEFSAIDGAFVVRGDGVILNSGRYLAPRSKLEEPLPQGLGTVYRTRLTFGPADSVAPLAAPTATVRVADLLP